MRPNDRRLDPFRARSQERGHAGRVIALTIIAALLAIAAMPTAVDAFDEVVAPSSLATHRSDVDGNGVATNHKRVHFETRAGPAIRITSAGDVRQGTRTVVFIATLVFSAWLLAAMHRAGRRLLPAMALPPPRWFGVIDGARAPPVPPST